MSTKGISQERYGHFEEIQIQLRDILGELYDASRLEQGDILVIGCSTSEVAGGTYRHLFQSGDRGMPVSDSPSFLQGKRNLPGLPVL